MKVHCHTPAAPLRRITGFVQQRNGHYAARLECGHEARVIHRPPMHNRYWILYERTRAERLGSLLRCRRCAP